MATHEPTVLYREDFWKPREDPPAVSVEISVEPAEAGWWRWRVNIKTVDFRGIASAATAKFEADSQLKAELHAYKEAVSSLAELLAQRVSLSK